jgi:hypothetical protein
MVKLEQVELQVLARINASPDGAILRQILARRLSECDQANRKLDGPELHRSQGRAQELALLLVDLTGARDKVESRRTAVDGNVVRANAWKP